eukprot:gnl/MRDRNA2_/MRDRNA2_90750_c0_seq1.p2 gnl/MRDRNA2_/MRDRNA2_90750_c0~~gnl/MRDRNA2_/MRDRNA2_90750_c0_seq1.p2  ORF type:complete len:183 (-),score=35.93 gnl/MRDRNA2_/MRDRNA2_90750_c0_seq1:48-596(-)
MLLSACRRFGTGLARPMASRTGIQRFAPAGVRAFGAGGDPRAHLFPDGNLIEHEDAENYHDADPLEHRPPLNLVQERGKTWIKGVETRSFEDIFGIGRQDQLPFYPRSRLLLFGNYKLLMKAEYCFFYIPTLIIFGMVLPAFVTIYASDEAVFATMTVKVTGRQWYWVYEVESPTDDDDEDE